MKILFVCKYNRFRSKVAEIIASNIYNEIKVKSAGINIDKEKPYIAHDVLLILKEKGYLIKNEYRNSKIINQRMINQSDKIIIVADNVENSFFENNNHKIVRWEIEDVDEHDTIGKIKTISIIEKKVKRIFKE
ncbi:hypothetical protein J4221_04535 [Candidatus Pacearchaeota archaeon]|nr:hypothetical protein [Candidatus Pacearchaeota archaeon]